MGHPVAHDMGQVGFLLESPHGVVLKHALTITLPLTNNQTKYKACLASLKITADMKLQVQKVFSNSKLMVNQLNRGYQVKELIMERYVDKIGLLKEKFKKLEFAYIPRE